MAERHTLKSGLGPFPPALAPQSLGQTPQENLLPKAHSSYCGISTGWATEQATLKPHLPKEPCVAKGPEFRGWAGGLWVLLLPTLTIALQTPIT